MKRILLLIITAYLVNLCSAQELFLKNFTDNELFVILNGAEEDINTLSKVKEKLAKDYKKSKKDEELKSIDQMEFEQFLIQLENEMYKRMNLRSDETPYHYIAKTGKLKYLQFHSTLFRKFNINKKTDKFNSPRNSNDGNAPIHYAISRNRNNSLETVKALVEKGADIKPRDEYRNTCLHLSARKNNMELVKFFLNRGLNINDTNIFKNTALHKAAYNNNKTLLDFLLSKGATIDEVNFRLNNRNDSKDYSTILHTAAMNNWTDIIDKALDAGISIDCKVHKSHYYNNATPLLYVVDDNNTEMAKYLIKKGANVNLYENVSGYTPLTKSISNNNKEIFDMLIQNKANINIPTPNLNGFPIYHSFHIENKETGHHFAKTILSDPNYLDPHTPEAKKIYDEMYMKLLSERLKLKYTTKFEKDVEDKSPIHWCAILDWDDLCEILIKKGTKVDITDEDGYTPLQKAVQYKKYKTAKLLIKHNANPKLKNKYGNNAFDIAKEKKDTEMKKILKGK